MELILSFAIGVLTASGIWLLLRPRSFQVIIGLCLLSYAVNLFIFSMGRLTLGAPAIMPKGGFIDPDALCGPGAAGPGPDGHRDQLCNNGAVPGRDPGLAGIDRY